MAEDFYDSFGLGVSRQGISTVDTSGVAFASIQALSERYDDIKAQTSEEIRQKDTEIASLRDALSQQAQRIAALEALVSELVATGD